jgi:nitrate reductase delta subunit
MPTPALYSPLARLFEYPDADYAVRARECLGAMRGQHREAAALCERFHAGICGLNTGELQELYTQTFDLNPTCALEVGWHLYGEDYHRGAFLVKMRQQMRDHGVSESSELPDHLSNALRLLERLEPDEGAAFASEYLLPALDRMRAACPQVQSNAFAALLEAAFLLLGSRYPYQPVPPRIPMSELRVLP